MTPLLGTKTSSTPVGDASGGDTRAARSLLSCALWCGIGRLWRGMGGRRPPHRHTACRFLTSQGTRIMVIPCSSGGIKESTPSPTNGFSRNTRHGPYRISHEFPRFPTISRPPLHPRCPRAGLDLGRPRSKRRSLPLLTPSGLLPPPRTQQEPMFRKENVLDCVDITIGRGRLNRVE